MWFSFFKLYFVMRDAYIRNILENAYQFEALGITFLDVFKENILRFSIFVSKQVINYLGIIVEFIPI